MEVFNSVVATYVVDQNLAASAGKQLRYDINRKELHWSMDMDSYCV